MYPRYGVLLGPGAETMLANIHTKTLFLSVAGVHGRAGMYKPDLLLVQSERRMNEQAQQVVLLADSTNRQQALAQLGKA